jgi:RAB protein geranylgeranyltransferase component A
MILAEETKLVASKVTKFKISFDEKSNILKVPNSNASTTSTYNIPREAHDLKMRFLQIVKLNALHPQQQQQKNTITKTATTTITKSFTTKTSNTKIFLPKRLC